MPPVFLFSSFRPPRSYAYTRAYAHARSLYNIRAHTREGIGERGKFGGENIGYAAQDSHRENIPCGNICVRKQFGGNKIMAAGKCLIREH